MTNSDKPWTVCFEGLYRTGKSLQVRLLAQYLHDNQQECLILKGDGSRDSIPPPNPYNLEDEFWKKWPIEKSNVTDEMWDEAYRRLHEENKALYDKFREDSSSSRGRGFVIMDRGPISRYFSLRRRGITNTSLEQIVEDFYPKVDKFLVLWVEKEGLLKKIDFGRNSNLHANRDRLELVRNSFDLWREMVSEAEEKLGDKMVRLDIKKKSGKGVLEEFVLPSYR